MCVSTYAPIKSWALAGYATFTPAAGRWNWTYSNYFCTPALRYSLHGPRAWLSVRDPNTAANPKLLVDWNNDGGPTASSYNYKFESKNILHIDHYLGKTYSDSVKIGFESAIDLDECLSCLPKGQDLLKSLQNQTDRVVPGRWPAGEVSRVAGGEGGARGGGKVDGGGSVAGIGHRWWVGLK